MSLPRAEMSLPVRRPDPTHTAHRLLVQSRDFPCDISHRTGRTDHLHHRTGQLKAQDAPPCTPEETTTLSVDLTCTRAALSCVGETTMNTDRDTIVLAAKVIFPSIAPTCTDTETSVQTLSRHLTH